MAVVRRTPERSVQGIVFRFHVGAVVQQALRYLDVSHSGGNMQRGQVVLRNTKVAFGKARQYPLY